MRVSPVAGVSLLALALSGLAACGDDPATTSDVAPDTSVDTSVAPDTTPDAEPDATTAEDVDDASDDADAAPTCEHPCESAFHTNDKSLCPVPQSEWNCVDLCCVPVFKCKTHEDCMDQGFELGQCSDDRFDCRCEESSGTCYTWYCGVASDCADGEMCSGGRCVATPATTNMLVRILDRPTVLVPGATVQLHAEGWDEQDADKVAAVTPTWSSDPTEVATVDGNGLVTAGSTAGTALVKAKLANGNEGSIAIETVVPDPTDELTIIVRTELTMEPVEGTYAIVDANGDAVRHELPLDGIIRFDADGAMMTGPFTLHVMGDDNDWVSWVGLEAGTVRYLPIPRAVYSRVEMNSAGAIVPETTTLDNVGVISGIPEFIHYDNTSALELVVTTQGLSSALFDFSLSSLLGADVKRYLDPNHHIPRVDAGEPLTLPGGIVFNLAGPAIPSFVETLPKGRHKMWSLGGRLDLNELAEYSGKIVDAIAGGALDFTQIVGAVFPLFRTFRSGYLPAVQIDTVESMSITPVTPQLATPMGVFTDIDIPAMPSLGGLGYADGLFLIAGAETADGFMVGLGLNGGADTADKEKNPPDGLADGDERTPEKDPFSVPFAPLHSGLQGPHTRYLVAAVAAAIPAGGGDPRPSSGSATLHRWAPGEKPAASTTLPPFLPFPIKPETNTWDAGARVVHFDSVAGADIQRVLFKGKHGKHWTFYGVDAADAVTVPSMADLGREDADDRLADGELESVLVNSIDFHDGIDATRLGVPGGLELDLLLDLVDRVSFIDIKKPIPAEAGQ